LRDLSLLVLRLSTQGSFEIDVQTLLLMMSQTPDEREIMVELINAAACGIQDAQQNKE